MDDFDTHWHKDFATGLRIGVWVAIIAGVAAGALIGWVTVKAFANAIHAAATAHEWRM